MKTDQDLIALCKRLIEEKFQFEKNGGDLLRQRDLEYLADAIESNSGIKLSLSTLKRLWRKDYDQTPHPSTLGALVSLLGFKDWQEFKMKHATPGSEPENRERRHLKKWFALPLVAAAVVFFWLITSGGRESDLTRPLIKGPVVFTGNKTVSQGVPNTVIFNYDVSNIEADSFFFQQSWNEAERVRLDPEGHHYSNIYLYPGFHKAKLIANDSIVTRFRVHITTDGWLPLVRNSYMDQQPVYIKQGSFVSGGALHVSRGDLQAANIETDKNFILSYYNVREFEDTHSDNFTVDARLASDNSNAPCPGLELVIMAEVHMFYVRLMARGCERETAIKMGEVVHDGVNSDLSVFGRNVNQWQDIQVKVVDRQASISLDGKQVYSISFKQDHGKVVGVVCNFGGTGAVDYVKLTNGGGKVVLDDKFDQ
jgi:hypothetical protein